MSPWRSTEPRPARARRWLVLGLLALPLAGCGKKAGLRLPDETKEAPVSRDPETVEETDSIEGETE